MFRDVSLTLIYLASDVSVSSLHGPAESGVPFAKLHRALGGVFRFDARHP
jgi:hypothetical protein